MIRLAHPDEADAVAAIVDAAYRPYLVRIGKPPGPMTDDYAARIAEHCVWVSEGAGALTGVLVLFDTPDGCLLDNIAVPPDRHGKGHGRALLLFAEVEAKRRGHREIRLYTHVLMTENIALYTRIGYVETARVSEKGFDRIYMAKPLT